MSYKSDPKYEAVRDWLIYMARHMPNYRLICGTTILTPREALEHLEAGDKIGEIVFKVIRSGLGP